MRCYCCSSLPYEKCCEPYLTGKSLPSSAEQLMRSRFSAYATANFDYILKTYSKDKQQSLSTDALKSSADGATWFALQINATPSEDTVEFTAYYFENKAMYQLHESSRFIKEDGAWRYHDGELFDDCGKVKYGRNLPCVCGSTKKFKQCCATKAR